MPDEEWRRRKEARPAEIVDAALEVFAEKGFAAAKLDDIARRAGISKATLYLYFEAKEEIFGAVARAAVVSLIEALESPGEGADAPFAEIAPRLLSRAAGMMSSGRVPSIARMVIGESRNFPDLARIWHDDVVTLGHFLLYKNRELFAVLAGPGPATKCPARVGDFVPPGELGARQFGQLWDKFERSGARRHPRFEILIGAEGDAECVRRIAIRRP